jgi:hypothetical protein
MGGYTVAIWIEPPSALWPDGAAIQLQRDFRRRVGALTWARFAQDLIPWAAREYVVRGRDEGGAGELLLGGAEGEEAFEDPAASGSSPGLGPCVVCERAGKLRLYVGEATPVALCDRCGRSRTALLATARAAKRVRLALARTRG